MWPIGDIMVSNQMKGEMARGEGAEGEICMSAAFKYI